VSDAVIGPLLVEGTEHHQAGRLDQAAACYRKVLELAPDNGDALHLLGMAAYASGSLEEALDLLQQAVAADPNDTEFRSNLAAVLRAADRPGEAAEAYRGLVARAPDDAAAWGRLAAVLRDLENWDEAVAAMRKVVTLRPEVAAAHANLGSLLRSAGRQEEAVDVMAQAVRLDPSVAGAWLNLGNVLVDLGRYGEAEKAYRHALKRAPGLVPAIGGLGIALAATDQGDEAVGLLHDYLAREPDDPLGASLRLAALGAAPPPARPSAAHMRETYARRAAGWDAKIGEPEHYPGLQLIRGAVETALAGRRGLIILDAGCGTGMCGAFLRPFAARLIGVDLSQPMLDHARVKGVYDDLAVGDLFHTLAAHPAAFDAIIAAAVLIHIGDTAAFLHAAAAALRPGGILAVTAFPSGGEEVRVSRECVYWHDPDALMRRAEAAGLSLVSLDRGVHEYSDAGPVEAVAAVWRKS
jgi:predicted TPR repeat methyltransferase